MTLNELFALAPNALSLREIVTEMGLSRSIVYRLLKTLERHRLVRVLSDGRYDVAPGLFALVQGVAVDVRGGRR